jgi:hypothetical protein
MATNEREILNELEAASKQGLSGISKVMEGLTSELLKTLLAMKPTPELQGHLESRQRQLQEEQQRQQLQTQPNQTMPGPAVTLNPNAPSPPPSGPQNQNAPDAPAPGGPATGPTTTAMPQPQPLPGRTPAAAWTPGAVPGARGPAVLPPSPRNPAGYGSYALVTGNLTTGELSKLNPVLAQQRALKASAEQAGNIEQAQQAKQAATFNPTPKPGVVAKSKEEQLAAQQLQPVQQPTPQPGSQQQQQVQQQPAQQETSPQNATTASSLASGMLSPFKIPDLTPKG